MPQFKVVLDDSIELDERQAGRINAAIHKAVLAELAPIDTRGDRSIIFKPETDGLIAIHLPLDAPGLEGIAKLHEQFER
jgi:hypothetical protein